MNSRPLPIGFITNHQPATEVIKHLKTLGYSEDQIREARQIRRKHKLSSYIKNYRINHSKGIQDLKIQKTILLSERDSLLRDIQFFKQKMREQYDN